MKTCIITGASSGIGRETAIYTSNLPEYDNFAIIARNIDELAFTKSHMNPGKNVNIYPYDLENLDGIENLVHQIYVDFGSIDCLLNIAGYTDPNSLLGTSLASFEKTYKINVFAPFLLIRESTKYMKDNKTISKIVNVSSTAGITPRPGWLSYASSKAAIISMSQTLAEELADYGIKVYSISPGRCATSLRKKLAPDEDQSKIMQPQDVAHVIGTLISNNEQFLDGQNIVVRKK